MTGYGRNYVMASYRKRGDGWAVSIRLRGHSRYGTFRTKSAARQWAEPIEDAIREGRPLRAHTLRDAFRRYADNVSPEKRGTRWERLRLDAFERSMPFIDRPIDDVTSEDLATWRDQRLREVAASTIRRDFNLINSVLERARKEWKWVSVNALKDVARPDNPPAREQTISPSQAAAVMDAAGYWRGMEPRTTQHLVAAAFDLALETAMRAGEIRGLRGAHIHLSARYVQLPFTKNGSSRQVPLSTGAVDILSALDPEEPFPVSAATMDATFRRLRRKAGMADEFTFHDSRATAITRLAKKLPIEDLGRMTGHKDLRSLMRYYRATAAEIARQLD